MNLRVAVQAGAGEHSVGRRIALKGIETRIDRPGMLRGVMTALAELGNPAGEKLPMIAAVNGVTGLAILGYRGMRPEERPPLFRVTLVTQLVYCRGLDHLLPESAMLFMTVRALDLAFPERVVGLFGDLPPNVAMTGQTKIRLGGLEIHLTPGVNGVATVAGDPGCFMAAHVPESQAAGFTMTLGAFGCLGCRVPLPFAEDKDIHAFRPAFLDMVCTVPVAGFAALRIGGTLAYPFVGMDRVDVVVVTVEMADFAGFCSASCNLTDRFAGGGKPTGQDQRG